ncbi:MULTISPECIES: Fic/DOC family protein [unclassified Bartonella]|uniref:Fic/DOC family protein n=1 Tax=unclassified Bartonella TaxID=2645622 RepID=UPI000998F51B|nr:MULTISPECIES: Fic family protein [unclassified Bartonella]AQX28693.1 Fido, protein-threonine AMPylation domain-containing protein [Bartonella sp. JB15]AQX29947.1 Fido, protein-threonine AMPylation domain-containing protein [Bartonella sp. JB63]
MNENELEEINLVDNYNYNYPNTCTLKNILNIKDPVELERRCEYHSAYAAYCLSKEPLPKKFDSNYLKYIHKSLFKKVFEWAGHTRDVPFRFSDGTIAAQPKLKKVISNTFFAIGNEIQKNLKEIEKTLVRKNNLQNLSREEFINEITPIFASLSYIRPFKKGNNLTQQIFCERLAQIAGYKLYFRKVTEDHMLNVCVSAMRDKDLNPMRSMFEEICSCKKIQKSKSVCV